MTDDMQKYFWDLTDEERAEIERVVEEEIKRALIAPLIRQRLLDYLATHDVGHFGAIQPQYIERLTDAFRTLITYEWRPIESTSAEPTLAAR